METPLPLVDASAVTLPCSLILEGGAMRCQFTAGVLDCFLERGLIARKVWGVSAGVLSGINYLSGAIGRTCIMNMKYHNDPRYFSLSSFIKTGNACGRDFIFNELNTIEPFSYDAFNASPSTLIAVSTDLLTGRADYHRVASLPADLDYAIASSSLPLLSTPVERDGKLLLDGATCDSIPYLASCASGETKHVVVLTQDRTYRKGPDKYSALEGTVYRDYPAYVRRLSERFLEYNLIREKLFSLDAQGKIIVLCPPEPVSVKHRETDRDKLMALYEQGYREALINLERITTYCAE